MSGPENVALRVWDRGDPQIWTNYTMPFVGGPNWRLKLEALNGTLWSDAVSEGRFYSLEANQVGALAQSMGTVPCAATYCFTGLGITWTRLEAQESRQIDPGWTPWTRNKTWYAYDSYGNTLRAQEAAWNPVSGGWMDYRVKLSEYYPNTTGGVYLPGLPARQAAYACPSGSTNGSCLNTTLTAGLLTGETLLYYDDHTTYTQPPTLGRLSGQRELLRWNGAGASDPRYRDQRFSYDAWGNRTLLRQYASEGTAAAAWQGAERQTLSAYDSQRHTYQVSETNPLGQTSLFGYDTGLGLPTSLTGPDGPATTVSVQYDSFGRLVRLARPGDSLSSSPTLSVTYTTNPGTGEALRVVLRQRVEGDQYATWRKLYDGMGRLLQSQTAGAELPSGVADLLTNFGYDPYGQVVTQTVPFSVTAWSGSGTLLRSYGFGGPATKSSFDPAGRPTQVTAPDLTATVYTYEPMSTTVKDPAGRPTHTLLDVWGRTAQVDPPLGPGVSYSYDTQDRLVGASRGGATTTLIYDLAGRKTDMLDPDMGAWRYGYYPSGSLSWQVDARNCQTTLSYDAGDRLTGKSYAGTCSGAQPVTYGYDSAMAGYGVGRRTSRQDASGTTIWGYDARGQTVTETLVTAGGLGTFRTAAEYNAAGLLKRQTYPLDDTGLPGEVVSYSYNAQMALEAVIGQDTSSHTYLASASYDASGRVLERRLGQGGNLSMRYSYYPWTQQGGRLQQLAAGPLADPSALLDLRYTYSVNTGNLTSIQDYKLGSPQTQNFLYDDLDRLTQAGASGGTVGNYGPESYTYSATTGNLASSNGTAYSYNDPAHVHAVTGLANATNDHFAYDANGNMTSRTVGGQSFTLSYDAENRMVGVSWTISGTTHTAAFLYNDDGKRVVSAIDGNTTVFVGEGFEWHGDAASSVRYYFAGSVRLAMRTGNAEPLFLLGDHLGSTSVVADGNGQQVAGSPQAYDAWGETRAGNVPTGYRFTGQFSNEADFGLYYYGARWYDSYITRFSQPDTIIPEDLQGTQAWDRYAYTNNNPLLYTDPSGHWIILATMLGGTVLGAAAGLAIYTANVAISGNQWNSSEAIAAVGVGAVGGFLIGTGVAAAAGAASFAAIGAGAGVLGGQAGYSLTAGTGYDSGNMVLSAAVSGVAGAVTGGTVSSGAVTGSNAIVLSGVVNGTASTAGYSLTTLNTGGNLSPGMAGSQFVLGFSIGMYSGAVLSPSAAKASQWMKASRNSCYGLDPVACTRAAMPYLTEHAQVQFGRTFVENGTQQIVPIFENGIQWIRSKFIPY